jgi:hypothetical protein
LWSWPNATRHPPDSSNCGHIGVPDAMKLKLAEHYGVTVADLMGWTDQVAA